MTQRDERIAVPPRDRCVGDGERRGLDPPAVVALDDLFCDVAGNVGDELLTRRGEFGEIVGERADETTQREGCDLPVRRLELARGEVEAIGIPLDRGASDLDTAPLSGPDGVEQLLASHARPRVPQDDGGAVLRCVEVGESLGEERVGTLLDARNPHESRFAEKGR